MANRINITIDGKQVSANEGDKLLWVALENGVYIPHLCGIKDKARPDASCRLCFVEIEGMPNPVTSCTQPVFDGMVVTTRTEKVDRLVATGFELLLTNHRLGCAKCGKNGSCELQKIAKERGLKLRLTRLRSVLKDIQPDESLESVLFDPSRCVLCGRCVWADRQNKKGIIGFVRRGMSRKIATFGEKSLAESGCSGCGKCVASCPVGAIVQK